MRKIVHLSDLHFGRVDQRVAENLIKMVQDLKPDAVVVSGDLTQRARPEEFAAARMFLDELPVPRLIVPGNHDIPPLYSPLRRFLNPYSLWHKHIDSGLTPSYIDEEMALIGMNTTHPWSARDGRVGIVEARDLRAALSGIASKLLKIIVAHHPFEVSENNLRRVARGGRRLLETLEDSGVDIFLSGHLHQSHVGHTAESYSVAGRSALLIHAGTAISNRMRNEPNSFNFIIVEKPFLTVLSYVWDAAQSTWNTLRREQFVHGEKGWRRENE